MPVSRSPERNRVRCLPLVFVLAASCLFCASPSSGQSQATLKRAVSVLSEPPGAAIWTREGSQTNCTGLTTPGILELSFHGENDVKRIWLRRLGFADRRIDVRVTDARVNATLTRPETWFPVAADHDLELATLNASLKKRFQEADLAAASTALGCARFEFSSARVIREEITGRPGLVAVIRLDPSFGGQSFRFVARVRDRDERRTKMAQAALEDGIAELFVWLRRETAAARLESLTVLCSYSTTESYLDTETGYATYREIHPQSKYEGGERKQVYDSTPVRRDTRRTVVKDRVAESVLTFIVPTAALPERPDKKTVTDAVLHVGRIIIPE